MTDDAYLDEGSGSQGGVTGSAAAAAAPGKPVRNAHPEALPQPH